MSRRATFARDVALFNFRSMVKPLHKSNLTRIFSRTESHTRLLSAHNHLRRVDLLNLAVLIRPDLKIRRGSLVLKINRLIGILYQQLVLAVAIKVNKFGVSNALGSIRVFIELDSLALAVLLLVLEDLVGEQLVCRLDRCLGRGLGLLLGLELVFFFSCWNFRPFITCKYTYFSAIKP